VTMTVTGLFSYSLIKELCGTC